MSNFFGTTAALDTGSYAQIKAGNLTLQADFYVSNSSVLQTTQIGDDVAAPIDVMNIYSTTTIGSAANNRDLSLYGTFALYGGLDITPATNIDAIDITGTNMTSASALHNVMAANLSGSQSIIKTETSGTISSGAWHLRAEQIIMNNVMNNVGAVLYGADLDLTGVTTTLGAGMYGLNVALPATMLATGGTKIAGNFTSDDSTVSILTGTTTKTLDALNVAMNNDDAANANDVIVSAVNLTNSTANTYAHTGYALNHTVALTQDTAAGVVNRSTNPLVNLDVTLTPTTGAVNMTSGFIDMTLDTAAGAGTCAVSGNMVALNMLSTGVNPVVGAGMLNGYSLESCVTLNDAAAYHFGVYLDLGAVVNTLSDEMAGMYIAMPNIYGGSTGAQSAVSLTGDSMTVFILTGLATKAIDVIYADSVVTNANSSNDGFVMRNWMVNTAASPYTQTGSFLTYNSTLDNNNAGGSIARSTNPLMNLAVTMTETAGAVTMSSGFLAMSTAVGAGAPTIYGDMVSLTLAGTNDQAHPNDTLRGYYLDANVTMGHANSEVYGMDLDLSGVITTLGTALYGLNVSLPNPILATGGTKIAGNFTSDDSTVSILTGTTTKTLDALNAVLSTDDAENFNDFLVGTANIVNSTAGTLDHDGYALNYVSNMTQDTAAGTVRRINNPMMKLSTTLTPTTGALEMTQGFLSMALDTGAGAGTIALSGDMVSLSLGTTGVNPVVGAATLRGFYLNSDVELNNAAAVHYGMDLDVSDVVTTSGVTLVGSRIAMPATYSGITGDEAAMMMVGDGSTVRMLWGLNTKTLDALNATMSVANGTNYNDIVVAEANLVNSTANTYEHRGRALSYSAAISQDTAAGRVDRNTYPLVDLNLTFTPTTGIMSMSTGFIDMTLDTVAGAGTMEISGNMVALNLLSTGVNPTVGAATLRGFYLNSDVELNDMAAKHYGIELDLRGVVNTTSTYLFGMYIQMPTTWGGSGSREAAIYIEGDGTSLIGIMNGTTTNDLDAINADFYVVDEDNYNSFLILQNELDNSAASNLFHQGYGISALHVLRNSNGGGSVTRDTNPMVKISTAMYETGGTVTMSTGLLEMSTVAGAGTPTLYGDMVSMTLAGTNDAAQTLRGYYLDSNVTLNNAAANHYGMELNLDGVTITSAAVLAGLLIDMSGMTTPYNSAYVAGLEVLMPNGVAPALDLSARTTTSGRLELGAPHWDDQFMGRVNAAQWATDAAVNEGDVNAVAPATDDNGRSRWRTNAVADSQFERHWNDIYCFDSDEHTVIEYLVCPQGTVNADTDFWFGLMDSAGTTYAAFVVDYSADTSWHAKSSAAGAGTMDVDTGIAIASGTYVRLRIELINNGITTGLKMYINGVLVATTDAVNEIPASGVKLQPRVLLDSVVGGGGTRAEVDMDAVRIWQDQVNT